MWNKEAAALVIVFQATLAQVDDTDAAKYLTDYGYIQTNGLTNPFIDDTVLNEAISKFQDFAGLEKTGRLDSETQELMQTPRCGIDDREVIGRRKHLLTRCLLTASINTLQLAD